MKDRHLEYYEVSPLPKVCENCQESNCYECDYALDRFHLTPESEVLLAELKAEYKEKHSSKKKNK